jgi:hypothetical protein
MTAWRTEPRPFGYLWEMAGSSERRFCRIAIGYDAAAMGWFLTIRYALNQGLKVQPFHTHDRSGAGLLKCEDRAQVFLMAAGLPPIDFRRCRTRLLGLAEPAVTRGRLPAPQRAPAQ